MKARRLLTLPLGWLLRAAAGDEVQASSPIQTVLSMIEGVQAKIIGEGEKAQAVYEEFSEWCEDSARNLHESTKTMKAEVADLKATIDKQTALIASENTKVEELAATIARNDEELKDATAIREKENANFKAEETELLDVIDTLGRAIGILEKEMAKGGASMLQTKSLTGITSALKAMVQASFISSADETKLASLLQGKQSARADAEDEDADSDFDAGAPAADTYESKSGGIVDVLQDLAEKANEQLDGIRKAETNAAHDYALLKQSLEDEMEFANHDLAEAKKAIAARTEKKAKAEGDLAATSKDLASDEAELAELHDNCMNQAEDFEAETKSRAEELKALAQAKKVITEAMSDLQTSEEPNQPSLVQLSQHRRQQQMKFEVVRFVRDLATKQNSTGLAQLAIRMSSIIRAKNVEDPFSKVKGLITEMVTQLEESAAADSAHNAFCVKELKENNEKEEAKSTEVEKLTTGIDQMTSRSEQLKEEVAVLQKQLAQLAKGQAEMDKIREEEKELYASTKAELEKALDGTKKALKLLNDYYSKKDTAHEGQSGAASGIIGLLEVCESDFEKNLAEVVATEEGAQTAYDTETQDNEVARVNKEQDVKFKTQESNDLDKAVAESKTDRKGVQTELDAVEEYLKKIHEQCDAKAEPYEETKQRREAEIAGLRTGLKVLEGEAVLLQSGSGIQQLRGVRRHVPE